MNYVLFCRILRGAKLGLNNEICKPKANGCPAEVVYPCFWSFCPLIRMRA